MYTSIVVDTVDPGCSVGYCSAGEVSDLIFQAQMISVSLYCLPTTIYPTNSVS